MKEQEKRYKKNSTWIYGALLYEVDEKTSIESFPWSLSTKEEYIALKDQTKLAAHKRALKWINLPQVKGKCYQLRRLWCALKLIHQNSIPLVSPDIPDSLVNTKACSTSEQNCNKKSKELLNKHKYF